MQIMAFKFLFKGCLHLKSHTGYCLGINSLLSFSPSTLSFAFEMEQNLVNLVGAILLLMAFSCFGLTAECVDQAIERGGREHFSIHEMRKILLGQSPSARCIQAGFTVIDSCSQESCCVCLQTSMQYLQVCGFIDIFLSFPVVFN